MVEATRVRLSSRVLYDIFAKAGVDYFCGVPDSTLSSFGSFLETHAANQHDIAANEGNAIGLAVGYHLATSKLPLVYMQNSGIGNALDPLVSLADPSVMSIPMILLIGWRGQPGKKDEPQHHKMGSVTQNLLETLEIPYVVLVSDPTEAARQIKAAVNSALREQRPMALLVEDGLLDTYDKTESKSDYSMSREDALEAVLGSIPAYDAIVATNGKVGRELFEHRDSNSLGHEKDLLIVGAMGHASSIALGIAKQTRRRVYCIDGDGAVLMHLGALAIIGSQRPSNFCHIVMNNGVHDSTGGQQSVGFDVDLPMVAKAAGYKRTYSVEDSESLAKALNEAKELKGPVFIEVRVRAGARLDLTRPTISPIDNKEDFMKFLRDER